MKEAAIILNCPFQEVVTQQYIICADGGFDCAIKHGLVPNVVIGDMDSVSCPIPDDCKQIVFPKDKDYTDSELALAYASENGFETLYIYGAVGGRIDHTFYNFALLSIADKLGINAIIVGDGFNGYLAKSEFSVNCNKGDIISLVPLFGNVNIIQASGLAYPISNLTVDFISTKCISNRATEQLVEISISQGMLVVIHYRQ